MNEPLSEDRLVQKTMTDYLRDEFGWESVYAYNDEVVAEDGTLGRKSEHEVVLVRYLQEALKKLNPGLPDDAYFSAVNQIIDADVSKSRELINKEKYKMFRDGVLVEVKVTSGKIEPKRLRIFDFENPTNNHFLAVRELWIQGHPYRRRPDILGFVNGIPLLFIECKNIYKNLRTAYDQNYRDYLDTIPRLFDHNAFIVLSNGDKAKLGSITSKYEHFQEWKRLKEEDPGVVDVQTMLKGICKKEYFMDLFENFILFDESLGSMAKIIARNHQYLGVSRSLESFKDRENRDNKLGVFWHTQGSGKSYSMVFLAEKIHRKMPGDFTFLIITDRDDLERQIYGTFVGVGAVNKTMRCKASSGEHLKEMLKGNQPYLFTTIQKFNQVVDPENPYSDRNDVIVVSDEAHRTQGGILALNMHNALPNAQYIGFTGTPLIKGEDEITARLFGSYVSIYDFKRAVDDGATVPLYYDNRGEKLHLATTDINAKIADVLEQTEHDPNQEALLEKEISREYHVITAGERLDRIAKDFVRHYTTEWENGKAMFICIDKITTVRMHQLIGKYWQERLKDLESSLSVVTDEQELQERKKQIEWMKSTIIAPIFSEEQGEVDKFRKWKLDVIPHRTLMKNGFETTDGKKIDVETAFKLAVHPFRVAVVCAMWLTGFDVPSLATMYIDKPLKAHTLMQAIARANRVYQEKNNGLVVDYCGILKNLREALATFAQGGFGPPGGITTDPVEPEEELIAQLSESISMTKKFLSDKGFDLTDIQTQQGFERNGAIVKAKEIVNENEESRKRFEIFAREVFRKFKACITFEDINKYRDDFVSINVIYRKLTDDREKADITEIIKKLHDIIEPAIKALPEATADTGKLYDLSKIDFDRLRVEFAKYGEKHSAVYELSAAIEKRLAKMIAKNPKRTDFEKKYRDIIAAYNKEKDRVTIEQTFEELLQFIDSLYDEEKRAVREDLHEEDLAIFDILVSGKKLSAQQREKVKSVAKDLLVKLETEKLKQKMWWQNEALRAEVKVFITDKLYDEKAGLPPDVYTYDEVISRSDSVYEYVLHSLVMPNMQYQQFYEQ